MKRPLQIAANTAAVVLIAILIVIGDIAAITQWIPHAGFNGGRPDTLGYVALYIFFTFANSLCWALTAGFAYAPFVPFGP